MAKYLRYAGEFLSIKGVAWRCEIWQEADAAYESVGELDFASGALSIEWAEKSKEEVICGSTATITLLSPSDRSYIDLYSIQAGQARLDVYRAGALYWSGCMDTEFYEEPYSEEKNYEVSLTFSDFGILKRIPYALTGDQTLDALVSKALELSDVQFKERKDSISSQDTGGNSLTLSALKVASANFYDELGEASTWEEVVTGILQPLALRMAQRAGVVYIYDINSVAASAASEVQWADTDQKLSADSVYNNISVTFSPYASDSLADGELDYSDTYGPEWTNLTNADDGAKYAGSTPPSGMTVPSCRTWYLDYNASHRTEYGWDYALTGFTLFQSKDVSKVEGIVTLGSGCRFFRIVPLLNGSEIQGVAWGYYTGGHGSLASGYPKLEGNSLTLTTHSLAFKTAGISLPALPESERQSTPLKLELDMLMDARYNPWSDADNDGNEGANYESVKNTTAFVFVPCNVELYGENGAALYHWSNADIVKNGAPASYVLNLEGEWKEGAASGIEAYLAYYDPDDYESGSGAQKWRTNRQAFGVPLIQSGDRTGTPCYKDADGNLKKWWSFDSFAKQPDGQFLPYPPAGGTLKITIYGGPMAFRYGAGFSEDLSTSQFNTDGNYAKLRWILFGPPRLTVVSSSANLEAVEVGDFEYSGEAASGAKEELAIDTICGSAPYSCPTARGVLRRSSGGEALSHLVRASREDSPEQLLIGTLYSQYATRHTVLSGTAELVTGFPTFSDAAQPSGTVFLAVSEVQNCREETSEMTLSEISEDNYTS